MQLHRLLDKKLIVGIILEASPILLYGPVTNYFYYGGGWPFVPLFFITIYGVGSVYVFRSQAPGLLKMLLVFWWVIYLVVRLIAVLFAG